MKLDAEKIRDISVEVYKQRLEDASPALPGAAQRMLEADGDNGEKMRSRAESYDPLTRAYIKVLGVNAATV